MFKWIRCCPAIFLYCYLYVKSVDRIHFFLCVSSAWAPCCKSRTVALWIWPQVLSTGLGTRWEKWRELTDWLYTLHIYSCLCPGVSSSIVPHDSKSFVSGKGPVLTSRKEALSIYLSVYLLSIYLAINLIPRCFIMRSGTRLNVLVLYFWLLLKH